MRGRLPLKVSVPLFLPAARQRGEVRGERRAIVRRLEVAGKARLRIDQDERGRVIHRVLVADARILHLREAERRRKPLHLAPLADRADERRVEVREVAPDDFRSEAYKNVTHGGGPFNLPTDIDVAPTGDMFVTDGYGNARVHKFTSDGRLLFSWGEPGTGPG